MIPQTGLVLSKRVDAADPVAESFGDEEASAPVEDGAPSGGEAHAGGRPIDLVRAASAAVWESGVSAYALEIPDALLAAKPRVRR